MKKEEDYIIEQVFVKELEETNQASISDLVGGERLFWKMKKIILNQQERLNKLEFLVAELRGEVEPSDNQKLSL